MPRQARRPGETNPTRKKRPRKGKPRTRHVAVPYRERGEKRAVFRASWAEVEGRVGVHVTGRCPGCEGQMNRTLWLFSPGAMGGHEENFLEPARAVERRPAPPVGEFVICNCGEQHREEADKSSHTNCGASFYATFDWEDS